MCQKENHEPTGIVDIILRDAYKRSEETDTGGGVSTPNPPEQEKSHT